MGKKNTRKINAGRVCFGISRIGYTPSSAICDITDNAISANAKNVHIFIIKKDKTLNNNRKDNVLEYLIIDDGDGMNSEEVGNALDLGSDDSDYADNTLSRFGLGLKSASFAQGNRLEVISGNGISIHKEYVDLDEIEDEYYSVEDDLSEADDELIKKYFREEKYGTIIRITKIHQNNHPSIKDTIDALKEKIGVIYYYFLKKDLHIFIENEEIIAFDPLFVDEAGSNNLDENVWDGKSVQWLSRPETITIDADMGVEGEVEITMLPHPKVYKTDGISDASIREKYHIKAENYGFYIYRNGRLINWANKLGIIPYDQDYYAFRGRINIKSSADDAFNIDVSKTNISLSKEAHDALDDYVAEYKRKCKQAWKNAYSKYRALVTEDSNDISNDMINDISDDLDADILGDGDYSDIEFERRVNELVEESKKKSIEETITRINDIENKTVKQEELTAEEIIETVKGSSSVDELDKIFKVYSLNDNKLWDPYVDAEKKDCVRISKSHRYAKLIYENNSDNKDLQVLFELLMYIEAKAELKVRKSFQNVEYEKVTAIMEEYRVTVSELLAKLCRKQENNLPPYLGDK